jgi:DNA polymerase III beta subunit
MKITTTVEAFVAALKASVCEKKTATIPILNYVKVAGTQIIGTDLDLFTIIPFKGKATGKGEFTISPKQAIAVLAGEKGALVIEYKAPKKPAKDEVQEQPMATLTIEGTVFNLPTMNVNNFPLIPDVPEPAFSMDGDAFSLLLKRTRFAISNIESRYTLNGALLETARDTVRMVGTDGHRLSLAEVIVEGVPYASDKAVRTVVGVGALDWLKTRVNGSISIAVTATHQAFVTGGNVLIARKLSGTFPNYEAIMPNKVEITTQVPSASKLAATLARVAKCADERSGCVRLTLGPESTLHAESYDRGSATAKLELDVEGGPITIGLNSGYLLDFFKVAGDVPVNISLSNPQSAGMLSTEPSDSTFRYVVMPMRL